MDYQRIIIVVALLSGLLACLIVIKLLHRKKIISTSGGNLKLIQSLPLTKEASAHVVRYGNFELIVAASKNGSSTIFQLNHEDRGLNDGTEIKRLT